MSTAANVLLEPYESIGSDWDGLSEEDRKSRLTELGINTQGLYWFELTVGQQKKIYNAWRRWYASCE